MIDFNKPAREKTPEEKAFDNANKEYTEKFGRPYVFDFASDFATLDETISDIRRRIRENDPQKAPEYEKGVLY